MKEACTEIVNDKIIVFHEKKSKLSLINSERLEVTKVSIDGCEITDGIRCDYLLIANGIEHFIELKGQDIEHAINQIKRSITLLSEDLRTKNKVCYIICTRSPLTSASIQHFQALFKKQFNSRLVVRSSPYQEKI